MKRNSMSPALMVAALVGMMGLPGVVQATPRPRKLLGHSKRDRNPDESVDRLQAAKEKRLRKQMKRSGWTLVQQAKFLMQEGVPLTEAEQDAIEWDRY